MSSRQSCPALSDSATRVLAHVAHLLSDGFTGEIVLVCHEGGVRSVKAGQVWRASELRGEREAA